jgi:hypothetical protein
MRQWIRTWEVSDENPNRHVICTWDEGVVYEYHRVTCRPNTDTKGAEGRSCVKAEKRSHHVKRV